MDRSLRFVGVSKLARLALLAGLALAMLAMPIAEGFADEEPAEPSAVQAIDPACADTTTGRFGDIDGTHAAAIECIGWWGVTQGTQVRVYDPGGEVRRDQMASFLAGLYELSGGTLPDDPPSPFADTSGTHAAAIDQMAEVGVLSGVGDGRYAPDRVVTRAQMATFLSNLWNARTGGALARGEASFVDIAGDSHEASILRVATAGLAGGVGEGRYDPSGTVTRAQMATFLARTLARLVVEGHTAYPPADPVPLPEEPEPEPDSVRSTVAAGVTHTCALTADDHSSWDCWGNNWGGQLGGGTAGDDDGVNTREDPVRVRGLDDIEDLQGGLFHSCALHRDGTVSCWGENNAGQVGDGTTERRLAPTRVDGLNDAKRLSVFNVHGCVLRGDGQVSCWGSNRNGRLGDGTTSTRTTPIEVPGITDAAEVAAGYAHTCVRHDDGAVSCWGDNRFGAVGDGTTTDRDSPVRVDGIDDAIHVDAGSYRTCVVHTAGTVSCWGLAAGADTGDGGVIDDALRPVQVQDLDEVVELASGEGTTCARRLDGDVWCWGRGSDGQLGDGGRFRELSPVQVVGIDDAVQLVSGMKHICSRRATGRMYCWGENMSSQLGDGPLNWFEPTEIPGTRISPDTLR